jgi:hypothetical protein
VLRNPAATNFPRLAGKFSHAILATLLLAAAATLAFAVGEKIRLVSKYLPGQTLRYRVAMRTVSKSNTTTPIINPEGGSEFKQSVMIVVRLEFLEASAPTPASTSASTPASANPSHPDPSAQAGIRVRATFEQSVATVETDAVNPAAPPPEDRYKKLAGHSIEFTLTPAGEFASFAGLDGIQESSASAATFFAWLPGIVERSNLPERAIGVGEKWSAERTLAGMPLTGLTFRSESSYLRDEPCPAPALDAATAAAPIASRVALLAASTAAAPVGPLATVAKPEPCAIILTRFTIAHSGSPRADATPPDYLKNGLRTMGKWSASGEGLDSISISTGLLLSATQSSSQDTDYTISSAVTGSKIHEESHVTTENEITLLAPDGPKT